MSGRESGPVSRRLRRVRGKLRERRSRKKGKKLRRQRKVNRVKSRVSETVDPVTTEVEAVQEELGKIQDEFTKDDDKSEQEEEKGGTFLANLLGAPAAKDDFDGDGDDDLGIFFGVDGEENDSDGPDPFAALDEPAQQQDVEQEDGSFTQRDATVFDPVADFEEQFDPAPNPFGEEDSGAIDPSATLDGFEERDR